MNNKMHTSSLNSEALPDYIINLAGSLEVIHGITMAVHTAFVMKCSNLIPDFMQHFLIWYS